jgi:Zn-dependent protease/CBS domain-containing protein
MRWSIRVGRVGGTEIRLHLTFLLLLAVVVAATGATSGAGAAVRALAFILLLFGSVLLHEFGHVFAASRYGIRTPDITLLPIGGVARLARLPRNPRHELVVALAGPAVTLAIALSVYLVLRALPAYPADAPPAWLSLASQLLLANVILLGFNLLPAFPMDGGRALRAVLAMRMDYVRATRMAAAAGQGFAILFGLVGVMFNPILLLIAVFVFLGARQEAAAAELQEVAGPLPVSAAMVTDFRVLAPHATLADAAAALLATAQQDFPVVDAGSAVRGVLTRAALLDALGRRGPAATVESAMRPGLPVLRTDAGLTEAFQRMQDSPWPLLAVADADGALVGLLTPENLAELVMIRSALARAGVEPPVGRSASRATEVAATTTRSPPARTAGLPPG